MNAAGIYDMAETGGCHSLLTAIPAEVTEAPNLSDTAYYLFYSTGSTKDGVVSIGTAAGAAAQTWCRRVRFLCWRVEHGDCHLRACQRYKGQQ